jgi:hypothetical protein
LRRKREITLSYHQRRLITSNSHTKTPPVSCSSFVKHQILHIIQPFEITFFPDRDIILNEIVDFFMIVADVTNNVTNQGTSATKKGVKTYRGGAASIAQIV